MMQHSNMMKKITDSWESIQSIVNMRTIRERVLLLVTGGVFVIALMQSMFISSLNEQIAMKKEEKTNLQQQYEATHAQLLTLQSGSKNVDNIEKPKAQQQLEELLIKKNESLLKFKNRIIPPTRIPYLLESMLRDLSDLKLVSLETIEKIPFNADKDSSVLYKHRVKITFTGEYQNMLRYLKKVEKLPFPIGWESLEYKVTRFPQAQIILIVYMLSSPLETNAEVKETSVNAGAIND